MLLPFATTAHSGPSVVRAADASRFGRAEAGTSGGETPSGGDQLTEVAFLDTQGSGSLNLYSRELARRLPVPRVETDAYERIRRQFNGSPRDGLRALWHDRRLVRALRRSGMRFHLPNQHLGRYGRRLREPYAITVHDLIRLTDCERREGDPLIHEPSRLDRVLLRRDWDGVRRAAAIIAISDFTRRDVVERLGVPDERVHVVRLGLDHERFRPVPWRMLDQPYVLFVGSEHPRKNLVTLLRAFRALKAAGAPPELKLVKVGAAGGPEAAFRKRTEAAIRRLGLEGEVVFAERVPDAELPGWYSGARCLVLPSLYEGFGLPPLEAMACGCPAIVSSAGALPEVVADAGIVVPPPDDVELARALRAVLEDGELAQRLIDRGLARASRFDWDLTAARTLRVYETLPGPAPRRVRRPRRPQPAFDEVGK